MPKNDPSLDGYRIYVDIFMSSIQVANMDIIYWSVLSSSRLGGNWVKGVDRVVHYFSQLQVSLQWIFWCKIQVIINPYFISSFKILSAPKRCAWIFCLLVTSNLHKYAYIWQACTESNWKLGKLGLSYIQYTVFNKGLHSIYIIMHKTQKHGIVKPLRFIFSWSIYIYWEG